VSTAGSTAGATLTESDFERLREFFYRRTGIQFAASKRYFVDKRVAACIEEAGEEAFGPWFLRLRLGGEDHLLEQLVNRLTVNETYFFREDYQFDAMVREVLPRVLRARRGRGPVRIMSVPCSTGDEPYSIALWLLENWPAIDQVDVQITGLDIDTRVLAHARRGVYGPRALQRVEPEMMRRYFTPVAGGHEISPDLRDAIDFRVANICDPESMGAFSDHDVILCRNLLIYFDEVSSRRAAENLYGALRPGGFLFLGHSESMSRISSIFRPVRLDEGIVYQRPAEGEQ